MRKFLEMAVIVVVTFGWWGFIYPELSMVTESCAQEAEAEEQETEASSSVKIGEEMEELGSTGIVSGNLCIKSRIAEYLYQRKEKDKAEKESGYEQPKCTYRGV